MSANTGNQNNVPKLTDLETNELNGPVHQVKKTRYKAFEKYGKVYLGKPNGEAYSKDSSIVTYGQNGMRSEKLSYATDGSKDIRTFNSDGSIKEYNSYDANGVCTASYIYNYNDAGQHTEFIKYYNGQYQGKDISIYVPNGHITQKKEYDKDDMLVTTYDWIFDENDFVVEFKRVGKEDKYDNWEKYINTPKGHHIEIIKLDASGNIKERTSYAEYYDAEGNAIKKKRFG